MKEKGRRALPENGCSSSCSGSSMKASCPTHNPDRPHLILQQNARQAGSRIAPHCALHIHGIPVACVGTRGQGCWWGNVVTNRSKFIATTRLPGPGSDPCGSSSPSLDHLLSTLPHRHPPLLPVGEIPIPSFPSPVSPSPMMGRAAVASTQHRACSVISA